MPSSENLLDTDHDDFANQSTFSYSTTFKENKDDANVTNNEK